MISTSVFKKRKFDSESLKELFEADEKTPEIERLLHLIKERVTRGRQKNLQDWKVYAAIDMAYDAPFQQTTPTIMKHVMENCMRGRMEYEEVSKTMSDWGLSVDQLFTKEKNDKGEVTQIVPNYPTFFKVLVPLVKAYVTIRLAKLFTDRNQEPFFKYEPRRMTEDNKVRADVITDIVSAMTDQYGYRNELRQAIFKTLLYSFSLMFPKEAWHFDKHEGADGEEDVTLREGLRYIQPHPTRVFYDMMHPLSSINTDTGVQFAGYWTVQSFRDVHDNDQLWNVKKITFGKDWFTMKGANRYFSEVYPCTLKYPQRTPKPGEQDRETKAALYAETNLDSALFLTYVFMKLIPKDHGLGDYDKPVWFRFMVAAEDTVLFAEPLAYCPVTYFGCDADDGRDMNSGLGLELIPWQDHVGNILSQILLTSKQNLASVVFYDESVVDEEAIHKLENTGENMYRGLNFLPYNSMKLRQLGGDSKKDAFSTVQMTKQSTAELTNSLTTVIGVMERLIQFSSQEVGSAASHQQSAQEIRAITANTTTRVAYTGAFIDDGIDAWKRQLYYATIAYMDPEFVAQVAGDVPNLDDILENIGFQRVGRSGDKVVIRGSVKQLILAGFMSAKDGPHRTLDSGTASVMLQTIQQVASNQMLAEKIGAEGILEMLTRAAVLGGAPKDFSLKLADLGSRPQQPSEQPDEGGMASAIMQQVEETVAKPAAQAIEMNSQQIAAIQQTLEQIKQMFGAAEQGPPLQPPEVRAPIEQGPLMQPPPESPVIIEPGPPMQPTEAQAALPV